MPRTSVKTGKILIRAFLVDLALQGGGSHGAFTWGVLDRLLEEPRLRIDAISGTSAGAMNAAVLADGWTGAAPRGRARHLMPTGSEWPRPRLSVRCSARPWIGCSDAGRSTIRLSSSGST